MKLKMKLTGDEWSIEFEGKLKEYARIAEGIRINFTKETTKKG